MSAKSNVTIEKSEGDKNEYFMFTLKNGMKVLLI